MPIQNRSYYDAGEKGRQDRDASIQRQAHNALSQITVDQAKNVNALMQNPETTPEQLARAGRTDLTYGILKSREAAAAPEMDKQKRLFTAAQYALQAKSPKEFLRQNFPDIAAMNPSFEQENDEQIRQQLQGLMARAGTQAGISPEQPKGAGAMYKYSKDGNAIYGDASDVRGQPVYESVSERAPPSGYRVAANGGLEPIPGGPADPNTPNTRDDTRIFAKADKLRDEFNTQSKDFVAVGDSFSTVKAAAQDPTAAGDLSLIFAYMKMLDPNSVVREQEFANAQNAAGVPDQVRNQWNKVMSGERLNPAQRADFIAQAEKVYKVRKARNKTLVDRYTEIAKRNKVNPQDVVGDMSVFEEGAAPAATGGWSIQPAE